jgi:adenylate cyclase
MRIGVRMALTVFVLGSIAISAGAVHVLWWRTAEANSVRLTDTINRQIVDTVQDEISGLATEARAAFSTIRTLLFQAVLKAGDADKREFVFLSQLQAQPSLSWVTFGWPDGAFFAAHKLGDDALEMMEVSTEAGMKVRRIDRYKVIPGDIEFQARSFQPSAFLSIEQPWFKNSIDRDWPHWEEVAEQPTGPHHAMAFAGPIDVYTKRQGVLAVMIDFERVSRRLASLEVTPNGATFILRRDGTVIAAPDPMADETRPATIATPGLLAIAQRALVMPQEINPATAAGMPATGQLRLEQAGEVYDIAVTPLSFPGWTLVTVIPQADIRGDIDRTTDRLLIALVAVVALVSLLSTWGARRLIAAPLRRIAGELGKVERFELEDVARHPSRLTELADLSGAIAHMAAGLAAFRKYLPADLVRILVREGVPARPGGTMRPATVMFADIAGFTGLSERLGDRIVPLLGAYLDLMTRTVQARRGTVDKFIGDAVMAFWGAPRDNPDHALDACRTALAARQVLDDAGLVDDEGRPLHIRIGINSGTMLIGNIGSDDRLNYTAIGDCVNVASRLEGVNKVYGTDILIGEETRLAAGPAIVARLVDRVAVYGRMEGIAIYELLAPGGEVPGWVVAYEAGLEHYAAGDFAAASILFGEALAQRGDDPPARLMLERCRAFQQAPPTDWRGVTMLDAK